MPEAHEASKHSGEVEEEPLKGSEELSEEEKEAESVEAKVEVAHEPKKASGRRNMSSSGLKGSC